MRDAARSEAEAIENDIAWRRQLLVADTRRAYVGCAAAGAELQVWQAHAADLAEATRIAEARAREGDTAVYDVRRTRVALSSAEAELRLATGEREAGCVALAALTGIEDPQIPPSAMTSLRSGAATGTRADLAAQEQRLQAASQRVTAARRARLPQFSVGAGVLRRDDGIDTAYGPTVSIGVTLPIWNGGGAAVSEAEARQRALEAELAIAQRTAEAEQQVEGITDLAEAVRRGAEERLVPILMTAISAGLALIPLALNMGQPGSEIQAPMAVVILLGLASSTALNMLVLPPVYLKVVRDGWGVRSRTGREASP